jgi:hypothetical protein
MGREVSLDLPPKLQVPEALQINEEAQKFDGIESVHSSSLRLTQRANEALKEIVGVSLPEITHANVLAYAREIMKQLSTRYGFDYKL